MGLWGVLLEIVKTAASHAAPHVARSAVEMARERMSANKAEPPDSDPVEQLNRVFSEFDQRIAAAEQRAIAAEERLAALQRDWAKRWRSAQIWVIALLGWNAMVTGLVIYLLIARK
jgi:hypothetical protein